MEFIDGEDLASLIRRIGYLTNEKALDIARQLTAGLSAAHDKGVLHRDLKPANIMIDGRGRVRITDFGIAIAAVDATQAAEISGTPAYMAPEQLAGKGATVRSDIYSLGLILYELCAGKRAFTAATIAELREQKEKHTPRAPSDIRSGVDPILERLITRCIDRDPRARPASVSQLGASLPGGDPLAAAIAAGETPSPEMVAAAGLKEGLRPASRGWLLEGLCIHTGTVGPGHGAQTHNPPGHHGYRLLCGLAGRFPRDRNQPRARFHGCVLLIADTSAKGLDCRLSRRRESRLAPLLLRRGNVLILVWLPLVALLALYFSVRFGLLAMTVGVFIVVAVISDSPMTLDTSAWYFRTGLAAFLFVVALSFFAFRISLGGRRLLKEVDD